MAFSCSANLRAQLNTAADKLQWAGMVSSALGNSRRIRCKRDANPNALDAWATGSEFRNVGSAGTMTTSAGSIVGLGTIKGTQIALPADMFSGKSVLRIEKAGDASTWIQGTLGPTIAAQQAASIASPVQYDFEVDGAFTDKNGLAVRTSLFIGGPRFLKSGTGPGVPDRLATTPHSVELWDWTNSAAPTLVGTAAMDTRDDDYVFEHPQMAQRIGDVGWYRSTVGITWGNFEMAPHLFLTHAGNTEDGSGPLEEVYVSWRYHGGWTDYPGSGTYDKKNMVLNPPPFKVVLRDANGNQVGILQMHDGLPVNDPSLRDQNWITQENTSYVNTNRQFDGTHALRPRFNCAMGMVWRNKTPKLNDYGTHLYAGLTDDSIRPSRAHVQYSVTSTEPLVTGGYGSNSANALADIFCCDQWPRPRAVWNPAIPDPYGLYNEFNTDGHSAAFNPWVQGWDYEPGSYSTHNWYTAPGGPRFDRCVFPSTVALYLTDPDGHRLQDNVPRKAMATGYLLAHANHSNKFVKRPTDLYLDNKAAMLYGYGERGFYYSNGTEPANAYTIQVNGNMRSGQSDDNFDVAGNVVMNGWARDYLHNYASAAWGALAQHSPMMAIMSRFDTFWSFVLHGLPEYGPGVGGFCHRSFAWNCLHHVLAWIVSSKHQLGFNRAEIEDRFATLMTAVYNQITVPLNSGDTSDGIDGIRRIGQGVFRQDNGDWGTPGGGLGFYMTGVLTLMKQSGMWDALKARGGTVQAGMEQIIHGYDQYCFGMIAQTKMTIWMMGGYWNWTDNHIFSTGTHVPGSWAELSALLEPNDLSDLVHNSDGSICGDRDVSQHLLAQWVYMRRDYFPEYTHPDQAVATTKMDAYIKARADYVAAQPDGLARTSADACFGYPGISPFKAPAVLGPL